MESYAEVTSVNASGAARKRDLEKRENMADSRDQKKLCGLEMEEEEDSAG